MKMKRISLRGVDLILRMDDRAATRLTSTWAYRHLAAPALGWLERRGDGSAGRPPATPAPAAAPVFLPRAPQMPEETPEQRALVGQIRGHQWYHTIQLDRSVRTTGAFDHEPALGVLPFPADLRGKRCLDVATLDGFWAFEMERRGASEVVALDIDAWTDLDLPPYVLEEFRSRGLAVPTGVGFQIAARLLNSRVQRHICNVYDLSPQKFGQFDFVFCGDLLIHLTNPIRVLQNVYAVTAGEALFVEHYVPELDSLGVGPLARLEGALREGRWWQFGSSFLEQCIRLAGFQRVEFCGAVDIRLRVAPEVPIPRAIFRAFAGCSPGKT